MHATYQTYGLPCVATIGLSQSKVKRRDWTSYGTPVYVAGCVLNAGKHVRLLIHIIRYTKHVVCAIQSEADVHCEVIRQACLVISFNMGC